MTGKEARSRGWWERYGAWHLTKYPSIGEASVWPQFDGSCKYEFEIGCYRQGGTAASFGEAIEICMNGLGV